MCYKGKCFHCIPVENGCLVFAILSAITSGLALVASIITGLLAITGVIFANHAIQSDRIYIPDGHGGTSEIYVDQDERAAGQAAVVIAGLTVGIAIPVLFIAFLIAFIFSVLLCNGICNRRPGQVKAYFIYGVVITVLTVLASVVDLCIGQYATPGLGALLGCVIYSLFLVLVYKTYAKLLEGAIFKGHVRLVES